MEKTNTNLLATVVASLNGLSTGRFVAVLTMIIVAIFLWRWPDLVAASNASSSPSLPCQDNTKTDNIKKTAMLTMYGSGLYSRT